MNIPSPRTHRKARIELIPLIDILFFLLATFFMVAASMIKNQGIPLTLPEASTGRPQEQKNHVTLSISADGQFFYNKEPVTRNELVERLSKLKETAKEPRISIHGDVKAEFGQAVAILDEVRKLGIPRISIETAAKSIPIK